MAGRQLAALVLSDAERTELTSLAARRNTAQALALRGADCAALRDWETKQAGSPPICRLIRPPSASGADVLPEHRIDGLRDEPRSGTTPHD